MDDGELQRLADEAAETLAAGMSSDNWGAVREDFLAWLGRHAAGDSGRALAILAAGSWSPNDEALTPHWRHQLRDGLLRNPSPEAADELRALVDRWGEPPIRLPKDADLFDFRSSTFNGQVIGVQNVRNSYGTRPNDAQQSPADWPLAKDIEPLTHGVRPTRRTKGLPALPPYVRRDQGDAVNSAVGQARSEGGLALVLGEPYAGKSRTALAALADVLPDHRVFAPARHEDLRELPALLRGRSERCAVWLDDLDGHLGDRGLEPRLLAQLTGLEAVVLATMREDSYDEYRLTSHGRLLDLAHVVELSSEWSDAERERARETGDPRLREAAATPRTDSAGAYLAVGPSLWEEWQRARRADRHPRGHALVRAAIDLARCGLTGPLPLDLLVSVHESYGVPGVERESVDAALEWAVEKRYGVLPMLSGGGAGAWEVSPYLLNTAIGDSSYPEVDRQLWNQVLLLAKEDPAYDFGAVAAEARIAFQRAAGKGQSWVMHDLGLLAEELEEWTDAETWFRRAAEAGQTESAGRLGRLLVKRGDTRGAEPYLETAAEAGDAGAATLLGTLLRERAAKWFTAAARVGNPEAQHRLGDLLLADGDFEGAGDWYVEAERSGYAEVARSTGVLHLLANETGTARVWLTRAAEAGDEPAGTLLAYMRNDPPTSKAVGEYFAPAAAYPLDNAHHGVLMEEEGHAQEARKDYEKGYEAGDSYAAYRLALLLEKQGNSEEAKSWYRKAADMRHPATPDTVKE